jgi:hypothetical protein
MGFGLTPSFGDRRGFMPPQLKTKTNKQTYVLGEGKSHRYWDKFLT